MAQNCLFVEYQVEFCLTRPISFYYQFETKRNRFAPPFARRRSLNWFSGKLAGEAIEIRKELKRKFTGSKWFLAVVASRFGLIAPRHGATP